MSETIHIEVGDDNVRYGIAPLDLKYAVEYGEKDELLVKGENGKIYYKRLSDGQIVTYDKTTFNRFELVQNMILAHKMDKDEEIFTNKKPGTKEILKYKDIYKYYAVVYSTMEIADKNINLDSVTDIPINITLDTPTEISPYGVYIRIHGNDELNAIAAICNYPRDQIVARVKCGSTVVDYPIGFNQLVHIDKKAILGDITDNNSSIEIQSIRILRKLEYIIDDLDVGIYNDDIDNLNYSNPLYEPTNIDIISYTKYNQAWGNDFSNLNNTSKNIKILDIIGLENFDFISTSLSGGGGNITIDDSTTIVNNITEEGDNYFNYEDYVTNINDNTIKYGDIIYNGEQGDGLRAQKYYPTSFMISATLNSSKPTSQCPINQIVRNIKGINIPRATFTFLALGKNITTPGTVNFSIKDTNGNAITTVASYPVNATSSDVENDLEAVRIYLDKTSTSKSNITDIILYTELNNNTGAFKVFISDFEILPYNTRYEE